MTIGLVRAYRFACIVGYIACL